MKNKSLSELSVGLQSGKFSSVELTQYYLDRIAKYDGRDGENGGLNSFITVTEDLALEMAKTADEKIAAGSATGINRYSDGA